MNVNAIAKQVGISPRKAREVAALVRGRSVADALVILQHTPRRAALPISKTIKSAQANAQNNHNLDGEKLVIESIQIGQGPSYKRYRAGARGMAKPYKKRTSNIHVTVTGPAVSEKKSSKGSSAKTTKKPADKKVKVEKKEKA